MHIHKHTMKNERYLPRQVDTIVDDTLAVSGAESLKAMDNLIRNNPNGRSPEFMAVICGMSSVAYRREDGIYVMPITSLGP